MPGTRRQQTWLALLVAMAAALVGCKNEPEQAPARVAIPDVVLTTPEDAARSLLTCLQTRLRAVAQHDVEAREASLAKLRTLVATASVEQAFAEAPQLEALLGDDPIEGLLIHWCATIAYYADGLKLDQMRRAGESASKVALHVPASGRDDDAVIEVTTVLDANRLWHVARLEFVVETPVASGTSQPASQPQ